jgi:hypothetical protein
LLHATLSFESKWLGNNTNGECTNPLGDTSNNWCRTGSGATAFTGGNENHVSSAQCSFNLILVILSGTFANLRVSPGTKSTGKLPTDV